MRTDNGTSARRSRPLRSRRALSAVSLRKAELALGRAEMRRRQSCAERSDTVVRKYRRHAQRLSHCRARPVHPHEPQSVIAHTVRRTGALIQQIARKDEADVALGDAPAEKRLFEGVLLKAALCFLPCVFAEAGVLAHIVEAASERTFTLHSADSRTVRND